MKGTFFQRPLQYSLSVEGESWLQGDSIAGVLSVQNHGAEPLPIGGLHVVLARGELSEVRRKSSDAFETIEEARFPLADPIAPGASIQQAWKFQMDRNCQITDKSASLFLLYGQGEAQGVSSDSPGQLQLTVQPAALISDFLNVLQTGHRFVLKSQKSVKGWVELKLTPPSSKAFATLEQLVTSFRFEGELLSVKYSFAVKKVEATAASLALKKAKKEFKQEFAREDYLTPSGCFNHSRVEAAVKDALGQFAPGAIL